MTTASDYTIVAQVPSGTGTPPGLVWPSPGSIGPWNYALDLSDIMADADDTIAAATLSIKPSGAGELQAIELSASDNVITAQLAGGVNGRFYTVRLSVTGASGNAWQYLIGLPIVAGMPCYPIAPPPSLDFGPTIAGNIEVTVSSTTVSLSANQDTILLAANPVRIRAKFTTLPGGDVTLNFGAAAVVGAGWPLAAPAAEQKVGIPFETESTQAIHGISAAAATVVVLEEV